MTTTAYISLGSNMGDRELNLLRAVAELGKLPATRITGLSSFYETEPVGDVAQDDFLNAVIRMETGLSARELLEALLRIEEKVFHRRRTLAQGPRTLDLDLLLYGDTVSDDQDLTLPHPRLHERRFVLVPLTEIAPDVRHPLLGMTAAGLLARLGRDGQRVEKLKEES